MVNGGDMTHESHCGALTVGHLFVLDHLSDLVFRHTIVNQPYLPCELVSERLLEVF